MNPTIFFSICSVFYCILLIVCVFSRSQKNNAEIKILRMLSVVSLLTLLCEAAGIFLGNNYEKYSLLNDIVLRGMLVLYVMWVSIFVTFIFNISRQEKKYNIKKDLKMYIVCFAVSLLTIFLPLTYITNADGIIIYSTGPAVKVVYMYTMLCWCVCLFVMFKNVKQIRISRYASLFVLISIDTLAAAVQSYYPSLLLSASAEVFVLLYAYINILKKETFESNKKGAK